MPLNFPLVYRAFTRNFFWAVGMVHDNAMQNSINDMRYRTGGSLPGVTYPGTTYISRQLSTIQERSAIDINQLIETVRTLGPLLGSGLFGRSLKARDAILHSLAKRADIPEIQDLNLNPTVAAGVPRYVNSVGIPTANAFTTLFFMMLIVIAVTIGIHVVILALAFISSFRLQG